VIQRGVLKKENIFWVFLSPQVVPVVGKQTGEQKKRTVGFGSSVVKERKKKREAKKGLSGTASMLKTLSEGD